jgi:hypothetical protein
MHKIYDKISEFIDIASNYHNVKSDYRDLVLDIIYSITTRKKIYCNEKFTLRDSNLFLYNKNIKANLDRFFYDEESFNHVKQYIRNDSLSEKLTSLRSRITNNACPNIGVYTDYFNSNKDIHTGVFYLKKDSNEDLISLRSLVENSCEFRIVSNYEDYQKAFIQLQDDYYPDLDDNTSNWRGFYNTTRSFSRLRRIDEFDSLVDECISNIESDIKFYKQEENRIKRDFNKDLAIRNLSS